MQITTKFLASIHRGRSKLCKLRNIAANEDFRKKTIVANSDGNPLKIAVALSGGVDSMVLLDLLHRYNQQQQQQQQRQKVKPIDGTSTSIDIHAITIDHRIRPESTREAQLIHETLKNRYGANITHHIMPILNEIKMSRLEQEARNFRYELLYQKSIELNANIMMMGHHLDDQIETLLLRLKSGTSIFGACVMNEITRFPIIDNLYREKLKQVYVFRPLLQTDKLSIYDYARENNLVWFQDESNFEEITLRNKYRKLLSGNAINKSQLIDHLQSLDEFQESVESSLESLRKEISVDFDTKLLKMSLKIPNQVFQNFNSIIIDRFLYESVSRVSPIGTYHHRFTSFDSKYATINENRDGKSLSEEIFTRNIRHKFTLVNCEFDAIYGDEYVTLNVKRCRLQANANDPKITIDLSNEDWSDWVLFDNRIKIRLKGQHLGRVNIELFDTKKLQREQVRLDKSFREQILSKESGIDSISQLNGVPMVVTDGKVVGIPTAMLYANNTTLQCEIALKCT
ncbi:hypothetical protein CANARDRAFT_27489 [[Candida] arabinofermentans NRRL YB-2248]|uniref:tRNA(Ile)-lysidine synthetase n=1 Tax=[Candida] arabinofermentans NRRL YB-2248 TaxID=983967 RepID=A0A1E4T3A4_9ASCO|nr:hypothetical protein CANARDRAFT_27489 [[Candida] arabinofermentans NRRL YB-2248]